MHIALILSLFFSEVSYWPLFTAMHSTTSKERPSSASCCRTIAGAKSIILERNNNNNDILSTAFHSSLKQDSPRASQKMESKFDSLPPSGGARSVNKNSVTRTGIETKEKTAGRQNRSVVSSSLDIKLSGPLTNAETGRRVSSGVEMMSRFAPRPYRPLSADSKVVHARSQSVEGHSLSGSRSGLNTTLQNLPTPPGRLGIAADDSRVGQLAQNFSVAADVRDAAKTIGALSSNKSTVAKASSSHTPNHSGTSTAAPAGLRQSKEGPVVNHLMQNANSSPRGSQRKGENLVKSNGKVPVTATMNSVNSERTTAGVSVTSGPKSSDVASSSTKSGGFTTSTARLSHSLPPQHTNSQTVASVSLKPTASPPSKMTNEKKTSSAAATAAGSSGTVSTIPPSIATTSSNDTTRTTTVRLSPVVSSKESSTGQTTKSNDVLLKGHPRDALQVTIENPGKQNTSSNGRGGGSLSTGGSNGSVKHRAVIKSGPESLLFSSSSPGPAASQKAPKDDASTVGDNSVGLSKTLTVGASVKTTVALENSSVSASRFTSSLSASPVVGSGNSSSSSNEPKKSFDTNSSPAAS